MKRLLTLTALVGTVAFAAACGQSNESASGIRNATGSEQNQKELARRAYDVHLDTLSLHSGFAAVEVALCDSNWLSQALGSNSAIDIVPSQTIGLRVSFDGKDALKDFAIAASLLGSTVMVQTNDGFADVPVCGGLLGSGPEPAAIGSNQ